MRNLIHWTLVALLAATVSLSAGAQAQDSGRQVAGLDELLKLVRQGALTENKQNKAREAEFARNKARQGELMQQAKRERAAQEALSAKLEAKFDENEIQIAELTDLLGKRLGSLKELFGVLQQSAGDARGNFDNSLSNIQYPNRGVFLTQLVEKMGSSSQLASLEEIEQLWFELQREMTEAGKVTRFNSRVVAEGNEVDKEIIRIGLFNIVADGKYLKYDVETQKVSELLRQPKTRFVDTAEEITE
ncbi:MAG: energy transducer TonB, partial [Gammaproteobacteria bacterium]